MSESVNNLRNSINETFSKQRMLRLEIDNLTKKRHKLEKELFYKCEHDFIYDTSACFDDTCKYICTICGLYDNEYLYNMY